LYAYVQDWVPIKIDVYVLFEDRDYAKGMN